MGMRNWSLVFAVALLTTHGAGAQEPLPRGFQEFTLGQSLEEVKDLLGRSPSFRYRGEPDVTFLLRPNTHLIEVEGGFFIRRGLFQFREDRLIVITLELDPSRIDYFSVFTTLSEKYGPPDRLDPAGAFWQDEDVVVSVEKPLSVKYQDRRALEEIRRAVGVRQTIQALTREQFLRQF